MKQDSIETKEKNAQLFRAFLNHNKISTESLHERIAKYVGEQYPENTARDEHNRVVARHNLRKELSRENMSTKVLKKGLAICGLTPTMIERTISIR